jgi:hypothetical protein
MPDFHLEFRDLLHAVNLRHGTHGRAEDFFALKNPTDLAGFEPGNLGSKGQHATSRLLKPTLVAYKGTRFWPNLPSLF